MLDAPRTGSQMIDQPPQRTHWSQVWLLLAVGVLASFHSGKAPIALPAIRAEFGLGLDAVAWVLSAFPIVGGLVGAGLGVVIIRLGARPAVLLGLLLLAVASAAGSVAPGLPSLLATRVAEGFGLLTVSIAAPALLERFIAPRDRPMAFGIWSCYTPLGMALAMMAAPLMAAIGWRGLWAVMGAFAAVAAVITVVGLPSSSRPQVQPGLRFLGDLGETVAAPGPRLLAILYFAFALLWAVVTGFLPTLLVERAGVSLAAAGPLTALVGVVTIPGNLIAAPLLRRGVPRWALLAAANIFMALCGLGIFDVRLDPWIAYALCLGFALTCGVIPTCVLGGAALYAPDRHLISATLGLIVQGSNLGLIVGPAAVGAVVASFGWDGARWVMVPPALVSLVLALRLRRHGRG